MASNEKPAPASPSAAELADLAGRVRERLSDYLDPDTVAYAVADVMAAVAAAGWLSPTMAADAVAVTREEALLGGD